MRNVERMVNDMAGFVAEVKELMKYLAKAHPCECKDGCLICSVGDKVDVETRLYRLEVAVRPAAVGGGMSDLREAVKQRPYGAATEKGN